MQHGKTASELVEAERRRVKQAKRRKRARDEAGASAVPPAAATSEGAAPPSNKKGKVLSKVEERKAKKDQKRKAREAHAPAASSAGAGGGGGRQDCFDFQLGRCQRGDACRFSHGPAGAAYSGDGSSLAAAPGDGGWKVWFDLSWVGTKFQGWQTQTGANAGTLQSIHAAMTEALFRATGEARGMDVVSRTDKGVHAVHQCMQATFRRGGGVRGENEGMAAGKAAGKAGGKGGKGTVEGGGEWSFPDSAVGIAEELPTRINQFLPAHLTVSKVVVVPHTAVLLPRCTGKRYCYYLLDGEGGGGSTDWSEVAWSTTENLRRAGGAGNLGKAGEKEKNREKGQKGKEGTEALRRLDVPTMAKACEDIVGTRNFWALSSIKGSRSSGGSVGGGAGTDMGEPALARDLQGRNRSSTSSSVRTVTAASVEVLDAPHTFPFLGTFTASPPSDKSPNPLRLIRITVEGDGFLRHMVRRIVGLLVRVGMQEEPWTAVRDCMAEGAARSKQRAPPCGLWLDRVVLSPWQEGELDGLDDIDQLESKSASTAGAAGGGNGASAKLPGLYKCLFYPGVIVRPNAGPLDVDGKAVILGGEGRDAEGVVRGTDGADYVKWAEGGGYCPLNHPGDGSCMFQLEGGAPASSTEGNERASATGASKRARLAPSSAGGSGKQSGGGLSDDLKLELKALRAKKKKGDKLDKDEKKRMELLAAQAQIAHERHQRERREGMTAAKAQSAGGGGGGSGAPKISGVAGVVVAAKKEEENPSTKNLRWNKKKKKNPNPNLGDPAASGPNRKERRAAAARLKAAAAAE
jgi:tRNA pseudouridine(38-40) synthase